MDSLTKKMYEFKIIISYYKKTRGKIAKTCYRKNYFNYLLMNTDIGKGEKLSHKECNPAWNRIHRYDKANMDNYDYSNTREIAS